MSAARQRAWAAATPKKRISMLTALLRKPPRNHKWDYCDVGGKDGSCGSHGCAIGLARARLGAFEHGNSNNYPVEVGMTPHAFDIIFWGDKMAPGKAPFIRPADVADALDRWLKTGRAKISTKAARP